MPSLDGVKRERVTNMYREIKFVLMPQSSSWLTIGSLVHRAFRTDSFNSIIGTISILWDVFAVWEIHLMRGEMIINQRWCCNFVCMQSTPAFYVHEQLNITPRARGRVKKLGQTSKGPQYAQHFNSEMADVDGICCQCECFSVRHS